jgi:carbamoyltransferase
MGLAPYGGPKFTNIIKEKLINIKNDGSFRMNQKYFNYTTGLTMTNSKFHNLFGQNPRDPKKEKITQFHMDIAASIQKVTEEIILKISKSLKDEYKIPNLCLAGGVALNCVANGKILEEKIFDNVWIQPAAGDAGGSLGAALALWYLELKKERKTTNEDQMHGSYLGPEYSNKEIKNQLSKLGAIFHELDNDTIIERTTSDLTDGKAIGWFQGRMEFGPRALGARSIIGDPRSPKMQKNLNLKVKYRESFRPFAPSVLREDLSEWFNLNTDSPYMLLVANVNNKKKVEMTESEKNLFGIDKLNIKRSDIPAVTHVDYSARIQTVHEKTNPLYYKLIKKFKEKTNCPVIVNTSFNVRGEPIVNTPKDAFNCFMGTELDTLVVGNYYLIKKEQNPSLKKDYTNQFELD